MKIITALFFGLSPLVSATAVLAASDYTTAVESFNPIAYYQFSSSSAGQSNSSVNGFTGTLKNGATVGGTGPALADDPTNTALVLNNSSGTQYLDTNVPNGNPADEVSSAGTILAWVNLASLPSDNSRFFYIAGESQSGNDFDLQIESNDMLKFYTDGGSSTVDPTAFSSTNQWVFIAATFTASTSRNIYINGSLVASSVPGGHSASSNPYSIGASDVFGGRYFDGMIDEVAFYNTALTATQISGLYAAANVPAASSIVPLPTSAAGGFALLLTLLGATTLRKSPNNPTRQ